MFDYLYTHILWPVGNFLTGVWVWLGDTWQNSPMVVVGVVITLIVAAAIIFKPVR